MDFLRHADADIKSDLPALTRDYLASLEAIINNPPDENHKKAAIKLLNKYRNGGDDQVIRTAVSQVPVFHGDQYNVNVDGHGTFNIDKTRKRPPSENPKCPPKRARTGQRATYSAEFKRTWKGMNDSRKWLLPSGRYVEDILYENFRNHPFECAAHSWVIDTSDESVKTCFDEGEWEVIHTKIPLLPELEKWFLDAALGYEKFNTADDLLKHINCTPLFTPEEYDGLNTDERDGRRWLRESISTWCGLSPSDFTRPHLENWYICSFWNHVFDRCMKTVPGSYMSRGETMSSGTSDRWKSYNRDRTKRKLVGHLYDGVLLVDGHELGVAEHSRQYTPTHNHKWVQDTLKVVKALHDMLYTLQSRGFAAPSVDGLQVDGAQVVGIVVAGWHCQNWRMSIAEGYTCLLIGHDVQEVPSDYKRVFLFIELLTTFWLHRGVVKSCKALLDTPSSLTAAQKAQRLINRSRQPTTALKGVTIPRSVRTDGSANESSSEGNGNVTD